MRLKKTHFIIALAVTAAASVSFTYVIVSTQWSIEPLGTGNAQNCPESRHPEVGLDTSELGERNIFKMIFSLVVRIGCTSESVFTLPEKDALWKFARNTRIPDDGELRHLEETSIFFGSAHDDMKSCVVVVWERMQYTGCQTSSIGDVGCLTN